MATICITGTNKGIGLELCKQYQARGDSVIAVCRKPSEALQASGARIVEGMDVGKDEVVGRLRKALHGEAIDILINNAGIMRIRGWDELDFDTCRDHFEVNTLGPLRVTKALEDNLHEGSKLLILTSRVGSMDDNGSGGNHAYRISKAAANMAGVNLMHDMKPHGIAVGILHPGLVATDMTRGNGMPPAESAEMLIQRIDELNMQNTGTFWHANGEVLPW